MPILSREQFAALAQQYPGASPDRLVQAAKKVSTDPSLANSAFFDKAGEVAPALGQLAGSTFGLPGQLLGHGAGQGLRELLQHGREIPGALKDILSNLSSGDAAVQRATAEGARAGLGEGVTNALPGGRNILSGVRSAQAGKPLTAAAQLGSAALELAPLGAANALAPLAKQVPKAKALGGLVGGMMGGGIGGVAAGAAAHGLGASEDAQGAAEILGGLLGGAAGAGIGHAGPGDATGAVNPKGKKLPSIREWVARKADLPEGGDDYTVRAARHAALAPFEEQPDGTLLVSTQSPTAKKAVPQGEDPRFVDYEAVKRDAPEMIAKYANTIREYPILTEKQAAMKDADVVEAAIDSMSENLGLLHDNFPAQWRKPSTKWYGTAHDTAKRITAEEGVLPSQATGTLSALSPQKDWHQNREMAERLIRTFKDFTNSNGEYTPDMHRAYVEQLKLAFSRKAFKTPAKERLAKKQLQWDAAQSKAAIGTPWHDLTEAGQARVIRLWDELNRSPSYTVMRPDGTSRGLAVNEDGSHAKLAWQSYDNIEKAIRMLGTDNPALISMLLGNAHKVRSFNNNIGVPRNPRSLTADTHHFNASLLLPMGGEAKEVQVGFGGPPENTVSGIYGTYPLYVEAGKRAAQPRGLLPNQMQSVSWEGVKSLFPDTFKTEDNYNLLKGIWGEYRKGRLSREQVFQHIMDLRGGFQKPEWAD